MELRGFEPLTFCIACMRCWPGCGGTVPRSTVSGWPVRGAGSVHGTGQVRILVPLVSFRGRAANVRLVLLLPGGLVEGVFDISQFVAVDRVGPGPVESPHQGQSCFL